MTVLECSRPLKRGVILQMDAVQRDSSFMVLQMVEWDTGTGVERLELYNSLNSKFSKIRLSCQPAFLISAAI